MSKPITNGHTLENHERILKLGKDYSNTLNRIIVIDKQGGNYKLTITDELTGDTDEYDLGSKIPPDTLAEVADTKVAIRSYNKQNKKQPG